MLESITIVDDLSGQDFGAVEVIITIDGRRRWCYFMTTEALTNCGDCIDGTQIRLHTHAPYMIVVTATLNEGLIEQALRHLDKQGKLEECSLVIEENAY